MKLKKDKKAWTRALLPFLVSLGISGSASALMIDQVFKVNSADPNSEGGIVTFYDQASDGSLASNQLKITFDNTSGAAFNTLITGLVFNVTEDINFATIASFVDGNNTDLTSYWDIAFNVDNSITPGNTKFDIAFTAGSTNGGIYNDGVATGITSDKQFPDIATLIINVTDPASGWDFTGVGSDSILRMQQAGLDGEGSWKILTGTSTSGTQTSTGGPLPAPATLSLLGLGMVGGLFVARRKQKQSKTS